MNCALHLSAVGSISAPGIFIPDAVNLDNLPGLVLDDALALENANASQAHFLADRHAEELLIRLFHEVGAVDPDFTAKRNFTRSRALIKRIVRENDVSRLSIPIVDHNFNGIDHRHSARGDLVKLLANAPFKKSRVGNALNL